MGELTSPLSLNRYLYGMGSPIAYTDPTGLSVRPPESGGGHCGRGCHNRVEQIQQQMWDNAISPAVVPPSAPLPDYVVVTDGLVLTKKAGSLVFLNEDSGINVGGIQGLLDILGFIPGPGDVIDAINGLISAGRGDLAGAGFSLLAMVPVVGSPLKAVFKHGDEAVGLLHMSDEAADFLRAGSADTYVYRGLRDKTPIYTGITNSLARRQTEHAGRFVVDPIAGPVTRGQARAIEQALIVRNPQFENILNSISPRHGYYADVVGWGESWVKANLLGGM
jgi:hypothetical protein